MIYVMFLGAMAFVFSCMCTAYAFVVGDWTWVAFLIADIFLFFFTVGAYNERRNY